MGISSVAQEVEGFPLGKVWRGWKKECLPILPMRAWGMPGATCSLTGAAPSAPPWLPSCYVQPGGGALGPYSPGDTSPSSLRMNTGSWTRMSCTWRPLLVWVTPTLSARTTRQMTSRWVAAPLKGGQKGWKERKKSKTARCR